MSHITIIICATRFLLWLSAGVNRGYIGSKLLWSEPRSKPGLRLLQLNFVLKQKSRRTFACHPKQNKKRVVSHDTERKSSSRSMKSWTESKFCLPSFSVLFVFVFSYNLIWGITDWSAQQAGWILKKPLNMWTYYCTNMTEICHFSCQAACICSAPGSERM